MHVNQRLSGLRHLQQSVTACHHLAQTLAKDDQHVGIANTRGKTWIDADACVARVIRVIIVEEILMTKSGCDGQRIGFCKADRVCARGASPATASDDGKRPLRRCQPLP